MKEKSAVRIMLLLNLIYIFQASNADPLNELLKSFVGNNFTMKSTKLIIMNNSYKNDRIYVQLPTQYQIN